jgi:hypothetical protein
MRARPVSKQRFGKGRPHHVNVSPFRIGLLTLNDGFVAVSFKSPQELDVEL